MLAGVFLLIELFDEVVDGLSSSAWPLVRDDLGLSYAEIGLLFALPNLAAWLLEPLIGVLADTWRRYVLIALGGLAYAASLVTFASADDFWTLAFALALLYPASGTFVSLAQSTFVDESAGDEERAMVKWTVAGSIGVAVGPLVFAAALSAGTEWRTIFAVAAGAPVFLTLLLVGAAPRSPTVDERPQVAVVASDALRALCDVALLRWLAGLLAADLLLETFVSFLALYLMDSAGATPQMAAVALAVWTVAALTGESALILVLRRVDGLRIVRTSAFGVLVSFPLFLLAEGLPAKLGLLALLGLASAGWYSVLKARFYTELEGRPGTAMAISALVIPAHAAVPAGMGLFAEGVGLDRALWMVLLAPIVMIGLTGAVRQSEASRSL